MKAFLLIMFVAGIGLAGCQKNNVTPPSVVGRWEIRQEVGGPSSVNIVYQPGNGNIFQFNSNGTYSRYKADTLINSGTYVVKAAAVTVAHTMYNTITFDGDSGNAQIIQVAGSTLTLGITYNDGIADIYAKL